MDRDETICHCMDVNYGTIADAIKNLSLKTVEEVGESTEAGTACGGCQSEIQEMLDEING